MQSKLTQLKARLAEVHNLEAASAVLGWDQQTYLPPGATAARARQLATLRRLAHEMFIDPATGKLLDQLQPYADDLPYESDEASLIRVTRRDYERALKVPPEFVARFSSHSSQSVAVWKQARPADDFAAVQPYLEQTLDLSRELADYFPGYEHIADPLIDFADYGMRAATIRALFADLRDQLVPIAHAITDQPAADDACLKQTFPEVGQIAFFEDVIQRFGYDFQRGRHDKAPHPFTTSFSISDVRITVRVKENDLSEALFSALHEAGHGMYEQGINPALEATPLADGTSSGVHESQSRLWENVVGRSRRFWLFFYPRLQAIFPDQLGSVPLETFYSAINKVEPSLIRTDADEVTYNLHVMLRFDFELALLEGRLAVRDLQEAWRERFRADLGIVPPDDRDGVLQDIHWFSGWIGGRFQGYTLGNILSAQFYAAALQARTEIEAEIQAGEFGTLHGWLTDQVYQHGSKFTASELVERATGGPMRIEPYIHYLRTKYGALYDLT
jgi:carboxypeptidase Taq